MRIISGKLKGTKLFLPTDNSTRPLKDMVKESIFNLLNHSNKLSFNIKDSVILDLFSGIGSFGLECLSREAKKVTFVENNPNALKILYKNINKLNLKDKSLVIENSVMNFFFKVKNFSKKNNLIFLDPPYKEKNLVEIIQNIKIKKLLDSNGVIIMHRKKGSNDDLSKEFNIIEKKSYGISEILFGKLIF
mgnify:FL=1